MDELQSLHLDLWREVGRHTRIQETLDALEARLSREWPAASIRIRSLDRIRRTLDTVGFLGNRPASMRDGFDVEAWEALLAWARKGELLRGPAATVGERLGLAVCSEDRGEHLVGPLLASRGEEVLGIAVLVAEEGLALGPADAERFCALLEPLAAALANDHRLGELETLRQTAEADRRSLLARFGRRDIGEAVVGAEGGLASVMERVVLVADSDVPVLLLGETGSGKEVIARMLRNRSRRASGPFERVNCGAIPPGLIDSDLFGHERGSFSGATAKRRGWFERAHGGTLLLDEVGELPPEAQVRLLRVLQDGSFERVGGERPVHVDVRVIAATHRDLWAMVREGRFREDLWYRLSVFPIEIPPLRDRLEDLPALATHFCLRACERFGTRPLAPTEDDLELLATYEWPGNVRELAAVLDRAVILGGGERLEVAKALGMGGGENLRPRGRGEPAGAVPADGAEPILPLDRAMALHIEAALARCGGRIEGADGVARLLQINSHTLRARMRKLGIDWTRFRDGGSVPPRSRP